MTSVLDQIDARVTGRVLIFGSLPPGARDLDLLVRPAERGVIERVLREHGFVCRGDQWALFRCCTAFGVEIVSAERLRLPPAELEALFADAQPVAPYTSIVRPAAPHGLLILARRLARSGGRLSGKVRARAADVVAGRPAPWSAARELSPLWRSTRALALLEGAVRGEPVHVWDCVEAVREQLGVRGTSLAALRAISRTPGRSVVVAISGVDGAGKSSQATALGRSLERLGVPVQVVWSPLGGNLTLTLIGAPLKRLLRVLKFGPFAPLSDRMRRSGHVMSRKTAGADEEPAPSGRGELLTAGWATLVLVLNLLSQRRAAMRAAVHRRVVVFDRHALDSIVRMLYLYGESGSRFQRRLARVLTPRSSLAFLLDVDAETAYERKSDDWSLEQLRTQTELYRREFAELSVRRLDGRRTREELCAEIAATVWRELG